MAEQLIIFPCNGNALEAASCINTQFDVIGFVDDMKEKQNNKCLGLNVYSREAFDNFPDARVLAVPGSPSSYPERKKIIDELGIDPKRFVSVIHPSANISKYAVIGKNVLIMGGVWVSPNAKIGDHVCILPNSVIHHDSSIGDYTLVGSNVTIAGHSMIGNYCYIGSGTTVINNIEVGDYTLSGMGTNIIKNVPSNSKIVGNPGRLI